ncbi:uncharacterized protein EI97DRAFT_456487 [Westerdykella ornata]|uniref:endo-1,3(4)-beta-glucanase n=1 Tax=Westerdykella ornata TaxID=318751 RepID=A0A6A6JS47_WESOR|nr:uncharacterized protein EI97DRAFT_456487 [Westerdykella ornata]KAF2279085.1 hypothetical protein EI97DRAFT_456487 [Westerdykella ornata]
MPSSSLVLRLGAVLSALSSTAFSAKYTLEDSYTGANFLDGFEFFTEPDPTNGFVRYLPKNTAINSGLVRTIGMDTYLGVDFTTPLTVNGPGRASVRVETLKRYQFGLFVLNLKHMPASTCGTWPAFWSLGEGDAGMWPKNGEIDIIEGVNRNTNNKFVLHTDKNCKVDGTGHTGITGPTDCSLETGGTAGCDVNAAESTSYGSGFNAVNGGVYAMEWTAESIKMWFFPRGAIPASIVAEAPDTADFGTPTANFEGDCDFANKFIQQKFIFNTDFCGDWAGWVYAQSGCPQYPGLNSMDACKRFVAQNPSAFSQSYWLISYFKTFKAASESTSSTSASSTQSSTSTSASDYTVTTSAASSTASETSTSSSSESSSTSSASSDVSSTTSDASSSSSSSSGVSSTASDASSSSSSSSVDVSSVTSTYETSSATSTAAESHETSTTAAYDTGSATSTAANAYETTSSDADHYETQSASTSCTTSTAAYDTASTTSTAVNAYETSSIEVDNHETNSASTSCTTSTTAAYDTSSTASTAAVAYETTSSNIKYHETDSSTSCTTSTTAAYDNSSTTSTAAGSYETPSSDEANHESYSASTSCTSSTTPAYEVSSSTEDYPVPTSTLPASGNPTYPATSGNSNPSYVTKTYTTTYLDVCSTGYTTIHTTHTAIYEESPATPTPQEYPAGFTTTIKYCHSGCAPYPTSVTVTIPIVETEYPYTTGNAPKPTSGAQYPEAGKPSVDKNYHVGVPPELLNNTAVVVVPHVVTLSVVPVPAAEYHASSASAHASVSKAAYPLAGGYLAPAYPSPAPQGTAPAYPAVHPHPSANATAPYGTAPYGTGVTGPTKTGYQPPAAEFTGAAAGLKVGGVLGAVVAAGIAMFV